MWKLATFHGCQYTDYRVRMKLEFLKYFVPNAAPAKMALKLGEDKLPRLVLARSTGF